MEWRDKFNGLPFSDVLRLAEPRSARRHRRIAGIVRLELLYLELRIRLVLGSSEFGWGLKAIAKQWL